MKQVSVRIEDSLADKYAEGYGTVTRGVTVATESFFVLRTRVLKGLKNVFSEDEIAAIAGCCSGLMRQPELMFKAALLALLEDSAPHDFKLKEKISQLSDMEVFFLLDWINCSEAEQKILI
jgi:hypothetical protein